MKSLEAASLLCCLWPYYYLFPACYKNLLAESKSFAYMASFPWGREGERGRKTYAMVIFSALCRSEQTR
jgi:hypothetical protein